MAHDGSGWRMGEASQARLAAAGQGLLAVCGCGGQARIDPAPWIAEGLGELPLRAFEGRLRCLCGARRVRLTFAGAAVTGLAEPPAPIFRFR